MKTVGVLGFGPQATIDFEDRFHRVAQRRIPQHANSGYPPMIVYHFRHAPFLLTAEWRPAQPIRPDPRLLEAAGRLGALTDFLVIAANAPHMFQEDIERASGRKVLSMIELVLEEVGRRGWKRVGVLGMGDPFVYTRPLGRLAVAFEIVDEARRARLDGGIMKVMEGRGDDAQAGAAARDAVADLRAKGVDGIILGCTEIPLLLGEEARRPDIIDLLDFLAEGAVRHALAPEEE